MANLAWPVWCDPSADTATRIVQVCCSALRDGTIGNTHRRPVATAFEACGFDQDLAATQTTCAVFVRGVLHWAGRVAQRPAKPGQGIYDGWLEGLDESHPSWRPFGHAECVPVPGAIFYVGALVGSNHVGVCLAELYPGCWVTAEGGVGDGTDCKISWRRFDAQDAQAWDKRGLRGLWLPDQLDRVGVPPEPPNMQAATAADPYPTLRAGDRGQAVARMQGRLVYHGFKITVDGDFGKVETLPALIAFQRSKKLNPDGVCGPGQTWPALMANS